VKGFLYIYINNKNMDYIDYDSDEFSEPSNEVFKKRVEENYAIMKSDFFDFYKYKFFDLTYAIPQNIHSDVLSKSINDIRGAIPLGQLALYAHHGADAVALVDGKYIHTELKTIEIDEAKIIVGNNNQLYYKVGKNMAQLQSALSIGFMLTSEHVKQSKNRPTYVIVRSKQTGHVIDAWSISGERVMEELNKGSDDVVGKGIPLSVFLTDGKKEMIYTQHYGWENWKKIILQKGLYMIRTKNQEDLRKEYSEERKKYYREIAILRDEEKYWESKTAHTNRLLGRLDTLEIKEVEKSANILKQMQKLEERLAETTKRTYDINKRRTRLGIIEDKVCYGASETVESISQLKSKVEISKSQEEEFITANALLKESLKLNQYETAK
jgi:hypothetical protein